MTSFGKKINNFLSVKGLSMTAKLYKYSPLEPITTESTTTLFSQEKRRLTIDDQRFGLFDSNTSALYFDNADAAATYQKIHNYQKYGLIKPIHKSETVTDSNYEITYDLIKKINSLGIAVLGTNQIPNNGWRVLDDNLLSIALHDDDQLQVQKSANSKYFMVNAQGQSVMLATDVDKDVEDFYELHRIADNTVVLGNIPSYKLNTVILAFLNDFTVEQIKQDFLYPQISEERLSDSELIYENIFCSDQLEINSITDLKDISTLTIPYGTDQRIDKYQYIDNNGWAIDQSFLTDDAINIFDHLYHDVQIDSQNVEHDLTKTLVKIADEMNILIFRQQCRLNSISDVDSFSVSDGIFKIDTTISDDHAQAIETVFTLLDKHNHEVVKKYLSLEELINFILKNN